MKPDYEGQWFGQTIHADNEMWQWTPTGEDTFSVESGYSTVAHGLTRREAASVAGSLLIATCHSVSIKKKECGEWKLISVPTGDQSETT